MKKVMQELTRSGKEATKRKNRVKAKAQAKNATAEIQFILAERGALHLREITEELHLRGYKINYQSVSSALSTAVKRKDRYKRTAPATFALRAKVVRNTNSRS